MTYSFKYEKPQQMSFGRESGEHLVVIPSIMSRVLKWKYEGDLRVFSSFVDEARLYLGSDQYHLLIYYSIFFLVLNM